MDILRIGVVGCGRISGVYRAALKQLADEVQVVWDVDKVLARAQQFAADFPGCRASDSLEDMLADPPQAVHILTPHHLHKAQAIACLRAGSHVLTEKPVALSLSDAREMAEEARRCGRWLSVVSQNRYIPGIQHAKELIQAGKLGALRGAWSQLTWWRPPSYYECDWKGSWETEGGGVVIDQAIHSIDLVRWLMDSPVHAVQGHIARRILTRIEVEDEADAAIEFESGAVYAFFACNYYTRNSPIRVEIDGEKGSVLLEGETVTVSLQGQEPYRIAPSCDPHTGENYWGNNHLAQIREFYRCIRENRQPPVTPEDATATLEVVLALYRSAKAGTRQDLPLPE